MEQVGVFDLASWNSFYGISEHLLFFFSLLFLFCIPCLAGPPQTGMNHDKIGSFAFVGGIAMILSHLLSWPM